MRRSLPAGVAVWLLTLGVGTAWSAPGDLDTTWGGDGRVATVVSGNVSDAWDQALQPDGKLVVVGTAGADFTHANWGLVRYHKDGTLDHTFGGGDGKVTTSFTAVGDDEAYAVRVLPNGKLLVAGQAGKDIAIARYRPGGGLDTTFGGGDGKVVTDLTPGQDAAWDLERLAGGKFLVGGQTDSDYVVLRYGKNGGRDMTFGTNGMATAHFSGNGAGRELAVQPDGRILETGFIFGAHFTLAIARFTAGGHRDTTFGGGDGKVAVNPGQEAEGWGFQVRPDGRIVVGGYARNQAVQGTPYDAAVWRLTNRGKLDPTFGGGDGEALIDLGGTIDFILAMAVDGSGRFVLAGSGGATGDDAVVVRVRPNGHPDTSFGGGDGIAPAGFSGSAEFWGVGITGAGRIVASGYVSKDQAPDKYGVARFLG